MHVCIHEGLPQIEHKPVRSMKLILYIYCKILFDMDGKWKLKVSMPDKA